MGYEQSLCIKPNKQDYILDLFEYIKIQDITDEEYVEYIYLFLLTKTKESESAEKMRKITIEGNEPTMINKIITKEIEEFKNENEITVSNEYIDLKQSCILPNNQSYATENCKNISENRKMTYLQRIPDYIDELFDNIIQRFLISEDDEIYKSFISQYKDNLIWEDITNPKLSYFEIINKLEINTSPSLKKIRSDSQFSHKDDSYEVIQKDAMNRYFLYLRKMMTDINSKINFIVSILFLTKSSFQTISGCLAKLYKLLRGVNILKREGRFFFINNLSLSQIIYSLMRNFTLEAIDYACLLIFDTNLKHECLSNYKLTYSDKAILFYIENNFDYINSSETSLGYFLKKMLPTFSSIQSIRQTLILNYEDYVKEENIKERILLQKQEYEKEYRNRK